MPPLPPRLLQHRLHEGALPIDVPPSVPAMLAGEVLLQAAIRLHRLGVLAEMVPEQQHFHPALTCDRYEVQLAAFPRQMRMVRLGEVVSEPILSEPFHAHGHVRRVAHPDLDIDAVPRSKTWDG